jgi:MFS family permease
MTTTTTSGKLTIGTLIAGCFAVMVAQIGIAIPATLNGLFQQDLHPIGSQLTWISDAFLLPVAVLELTFGVLGDLFGRKRLMLVGGGLLTVGELTSSASSGVYLLWVGQALAGLGAAALFPTSLSMLAAGTDHQHKDRARAIAIWAGFLSAGGFLAPLLGGITATYGSWRTSFVVVAILAVLTALISALFARDSSAPEGRSLDWGGQITLAVGLFALLVGVIEGPTDGWGSATVVIAFVVAVIGLALFIAVERRTRSPLLRLDLFRNRRFAIASIVAVVGMFSFLGTAYATSIRLGPIQEQAPLRTSVAFILLQGPALLLIPLTSWLLHRVNPRWLLGGGFAVMAAGELLAATIPIANGTLTALIVPLGLVGIGFAFAVCSITASAVNTVPPHLTGMASATTSLLRDFGFTLGPALVGAIALGRAAIGFGAALPGAGLPTAQVAAAQQTAAAGGPLAVNGLPPGTPGSAAHDLAFNALGNGYSIGYLVCGICALVAAILAILVLHGGAGDAAEQDESDSAQPAAAV